MKKTCIFTLLLLLTFGLFGCGSTEETGTAESPAEGEVLDTVDGITYSHDFDEETNYPYQLSAMQFWIPDAWDCELEENILEIFPRNGRMSVGYFSNVEFDVFDEQQQEDLLDFMIGYCGDYPYQELGHSFLTIGNEDAYLLEGVCTTDEFNQIYMRTYGLSHNNTTYIILCEEYYLLGQGVSHTKDYDEILNTVVFQDKVLNIDFLPLFESDENN